MIQSIVTKWTALAGLVLLLLMSPRTAAQDTGELKLRLFVPPARAVNRPFSATLYIKGNGPDEKVKIQLPKGMALVEDEKAEKPVPAPTGDKGYSQVSWKLKASAIGEYKLIVRTAGGPSVTERLLIIESSF